MPEGTCTTVSSATETSSILIRDIELISEMREVESLQKEVWACEDRDIVPLTILVATRELGAILIGAFDGSTLIGFAYSFIGREDERMVHHSHMLAGESPSTLCCRTCRENLNDHRIHE